MNEYKMEPTGNSPVGQGGRERERGRKCYERTSAPGVQDDGSDAPVFNYQGVRPIQMSHLGVEAQVWLGCRWIILPLSWDTPLLRRGHQRILQPPAPRLGQGSGVDLRLEVGITGQFRHALCRSRATAD